MDPDDGTLVRSCLEGDGQAFDVLVKRYEAKVFNCAFRLVNNWDDACDITQDVFMKVYRNLGKFNARHKFFSWIYRISVNESLNFLSRRREVDPVVENVPSDLRGPLDCACGAELSSAVQAALMSLKPDYRTVVILKHFQGCTYHEIAEILGTPEKTVKSRLFTARRMLRDLVVRKGIQAS